jgi:serine phosphatase RsbU (regulator of sigma subunit)
MAAVQASLRIMVADLKALVRQTRPLSVAQIISRTSQELRAWMRDAPQFDDLTFIVAKIKEQD